MEPVKVRRISPFLRTKIDAFNRESMKPLQIRKRILQEDNVSISAQAIKLYIARRAKEIETGGNAPVKTRPNQRILKAHHLAFIDKRMQANDETTAPDLQSALRETFGLEVSLTTISRERKKLGWTSTRTKYCQIVRDVNKEKRKLYCRQMIKTNEQFDDVIFTDESTVKMESSSSLSFRRTGLPRKLKPRPKHPYQIHVWAGISRRGATQIAMFTGKMDSAGYQDILRKHLLPFIKEVHPESHRLYQDNDPKHKSKSTTEWMKSNGVVCIGAPPESPDLNPIENIWGHMKQHLRKNVRPKTKEELITGIGEYWEKLTPAFLNKFIDHLFKVIPECVNTQGAATGY